MQHAHQLPSVVPMPPHTPGMRAHHPRPLLHIAESDTHPRSPAQLPSGAGASMSRAPSTSAPVSPQRHSVGHLPMILTPAMHAMPPPNVLSSLDKPAPASPSTGAPQTAATVQASPPVARELLRYAAFGIGARVAYTLCDLVTMTTIGRQLGPRALIAYSGSSSLFSVIFLPPIVGSCHAVASRTARALKADPTGKSAAVAYLRCLIINAPLSLGLTVVTALVVAPIALPLVWGQVDEGDQGLLSPYAAVYSEEVKGLSPVEEVLYAMRWAIPGAVASAIAWTTEYATQFEPELSAIANVVALVAACLATWQLVHLGLWAALLVPCFTFGALTAALLVGMAIRHKEWSKVVWSPLRGKEHVPRGVLSWPRLRNFAAYSARCALRMFGAYGTMEMLTAVVGSQLPRAQFAALSIAVSIVSLTVSFDEGNTQAMNTVLSYAVGDGDVPRAFQVMRTAATTATVMSVIIGSVICFFPRPIAELYTPEPDIIVQFMSIAAPFAMTRVIETVVQVWTRTLEALEQATIPAIASNVTMIALALSTWITSQTLGYGLHGVLWAWVSVLCCEALVAIVMLMRMDWRSVLEGAIALGAEQEAGDEADPAADDDVEEEADSIEMPPPMNSAPTTAPLKGSGVPVVLPPLPTPLVEIVVREVSATPAHEARSHAAELRSRAKPAASRTEL
jgi:Na+-driven multidrug efflux pump